MMKNELLQRVLSGVTLTLLSIAYLFLANKLFFLTVTLILISICVFEYLQALNNKRITLRALALYPSIFIIFFAFWYLREDFGEYFLLIFILAFLPIIIGSLLSGKSFFHTIFWYLIPLIWILLPFNLLTLLRFEGPGHAGANVIVFLIVVVAFNDIFAYFGGKKFGKHKLAPNVSPQKTIEGTLFGYTGALTGGYLIGHYIAGFQFDFKLFIIIILVTMSAQIGDLVESKFKRFCQIKDSGKLIPGHGGFLDRLDAMLIALPVFWQLKSTVGITLIN